MTPITLRPRLLAAVLVAGLGVPVAAQAAGPVVSTAPGRIVFPVDDGKVAKDVDAGGASAAVALPDGATLLIGSGSTQRNLLRAVKIGLDGALDRSFGSDGVKTFAAPARTGVAVLRQADGKLLLISMKEPPPPLFSPGKLQVTRYNADLSLDGSYGAGGTALTAINAGGNAALQADGSLLLAGSTGEITRPPRPNESPNFRWAVTRLTPAGAVDAGFGTGGIATIAPQVAAIGYAIGAGPGGTIVTAAQSTTSYLGGSTRLLLTRLTAGGAPDPAFAGGTPIATPLASGTLMLAQSDGSVLVSGQEQRATPVTPASAFELGEHYLLRYTPAGALDPAFGIGGRVDLGKDSRPDQLLASAGGSVLVIGAPAYGLMPGTGPQPHKLNARLVAPNGAIVQTRATTLAFGGGGSSFIGNVRPRPVQTISQNSFLNTGLVRRSDGSYLVAGGVHVSQPTGEGVGFSIGRFAAAALTPGFTLDSSFGGPATKPKLSLKVARQRARSALTRHGIRVELKSSAVGLARVTISHNGKAIARSLLPVFKTTRHTLLVGMTKYGNTYLRRHRRNVRVAVTATGRDLLTSTTKATARGRLK